MRTLFALLLPGMSLVSWTSQTVAGPSPSQPNTHQSTEVSAHTGEVSDNSEKQQAASWIWRFFSDIKITDVVIAFSGSVVALYGILQYFLSNRALVLANRPRIIVSFAKLHR